jgi:hypothetical protein
MGTTGTIIEHQQRDEYGKTVNAEESINIRARVLLAPAFSPSSLPPSLLLRSCCRSYITTHSSAAAPTAHEDVRRGGRYE